MLYYAGMSAKNQEAVALRAAGASYSEIEKKLEVSKSTLSFWFRDASWSNEVKEALRQKAIAQSTTRLLSINRARGLGLQFAYAKVENDARKEFKKNMRSTLFVAALVFYLCDGDKSSTGRVKVSNTDVPMLRLFVRFLEQFCHIPNDRVRATVVVYPNLNVKVCEWYWQKKLDFKPTNFCKASVIKGRGRGRSLESGICTLGVTNTLVKKKILAWLRLFEEDLSRKADMV